MRIYSKQYPITVYKKNTAGYDSQTYLVVQNDIKINDRLAAYEFTDKNLDVWLPQQPHKNALKKYYKPVKYTNLTKQIKRKICFILLNINNNAEPLNEFNKRNFKK